MDPQQLMLLMAILGGGQFGQSGQTASSGFDNGLNSSMPDNNEMLGALQGVSPVNVNPNYGSTVRRFFDQNPLAGSQAFTGASPLQPGAAGNNATRAGTGHSSFMPTDFASSMQRWVGP